MAVYGLMLLMMATQTTHSYADPNRYALHIPILQQ